MVRNTCGGNKTKGGARKSGQHQRSMIFPEQTGHILAFVSKILGNRRLKCFTDDGREFSAIIRAKFKLATQRIDVGTFVISSSPYVVPTTTSLPDARLFVLHHWAIKSAQRASL